MTAPTRMRATVRFRRFTMLTGAVIVLVVVATASLFIGSNSIPPSDILAVLSNPDDSLASRVVFQQRLPRLILVVIVGAALGVAGALMQALTRNPLADPGILGVNAGASLAIVTSVAIFGFTSIFFYMWFGLLGAALAALAVAILGGVGRKNSSPAHLALAGVAISMAISSIVQVVILTNQDAFNEFRFWASGSVENRGYPIITAVLPLVILGLLLAMWAAPSLNAIALSDEVGRGLGVNLTRTRVIVALAVTVLAGSATAAVGPILFLGLGVPHLARILFGANQMWVIPVSAVTAPVIMLAADLIARTIVAPHEIQTGIVTALIGGPVFVALLRSSKGKRL